MVFSPLKCLISALILLCLSVFVSSEEQGFFFSQSAGFSENPLGILLETGALYRVPLSKSKDILWKSTRIDLGLQNGWTPADDFFGLNLMVEPIAVFDINLKAGYYGLFDAFGYGYYGLPSAVSPYDDKMRKTLNPSSVNGWWCVAAPRLKLKLGRFLAVDCLTADYFSLQNAGYFLEIRSFLIHKTRDIDVQNDVYAFYEVSSAVMAGANYYTIRVSGTKAFADRLSGVAIITPPIGRLTSPFLAVVAGLYFRHPLYRMNAYFAVQAGFELKM
jgi:hypothetical protein